jgi:hypothetical protein
MYLSISEIEFNTKILGSCKIFATGIYAMFVFDVKPFSKEYDFSIFFFLRKYSIFCFFLARIVTIIWKLFIFLPFLYL